MNPTTLYKCIDCMGHYLGPYQAVKCHDHGYKEIYACAKCAKFYDAYEDALRCCDDSEVDNEQK